MAGIIYKYRVGRDEQYIFPGRTLNKMCKEVMYRLSESLFSQTLVMAHFYGWLPAYFGQLIVLNIRELHRGDPTVVMTDH